MVTVGQRIKTLRKAAKLTQQQLADELGLERSTVSKWESPNGSEPDTDKLKRLAHFFGVATDYLLGVTDCPTEPLSAADNKILQFLGRS